MSTFQQGQHLEPYDPQPIRLQVLEVGVGRWATVIEYPDALGIRINELHTSASALGQMGIIARVVFGKIETVGVEDKMTKAVEAQTDVLREMLNVLRGRR